MPRALTVTITRLTPAEATLDPHPIADHLPVGAQFLLCNVDLAPLVAPAVLQVPCPLLPPPYPPLLHRKASLRTSIPEGLQRPSNG